jgi:hypothetical protein
VPLKLVVLAGAQQVEHDATETKFCELILHKGLISISVVFKLVHPSSVDFPFVRKSVHTGNSENSAPNGQQKFEEICRSGKGAENVYRRTNVLPIPSALA